MQGVKHEIAIALAGPAFLIALAAVDLEKAVTVATPGPAQVFEGEKFVKTDQGFPVAEVIGIRTIYDLASEQVKAATHEVEIAWTQVGDDELTVTAQLERIVRATRDLFWPQSGPVVLPALNSEPLVFLSEEYTALAPTTTSQFIKGSMTRLQVPTLTL